MESLMERRTVFLRLSEAANKVGRESIKPDPDTVIRYNWEDGDAPGYLDLLASHAYANNNKLLVSFNATTSIVNLKANSWFVLCTLGKKDWLMGRIHDAGAAYVQGMDDHDGFTSPKLSVSRARWWVKLYDVTHGHDFPLDDYEFSPYENGVGPQPPRPLSEAISGPKTNILFVTRKPKE